MRNIKYTPDKPHSHWVWRNAPQGTGRTLYRSVWETSNIHRTSPTHTGSDETHRGVLATRYTGLYENHQIQIYTRQAPLTLGLTERTAGYWPHAIQVCMRIIKYKYTPDKPHSHWVWRNAPRGTGRTLYRSVWEPSNIHQTSLAPLTLGLTERTAGYWPHAIQVCMRTIKYTPDKPHSHLVWWNAPQGTGRTLYRSVWETSNIHQTSPTNTGSDGTHRRVLAARYTGLYEKHQIYTRQAPLTLGLTERTAGYWPHAIQVCMRNIKYTPDKPHSHWVWRNAPQGTGRTLYRSVWETSNIHRTSPTHTGSDETHPGVLATRYTGLYENHQIQIYTRQAPLTLGLTERTAGYWPHAIQVCMRIIKYKYTPDKPHSHWVWRNAPRGTGHTLYRSVWETSNIHQTSPTHTGSDGTHRGVLATRYTGLYEKHQIYTRQAPLTLGLTQHTVGYWPHAVQLCVINCDIQIWYIVHPLINDLPDTDLMPSTSLR